MYPEIENDTDVLPDSFLVKRLTPRESFEDARATVEMGQRIGIDLVWADAVQISVDFYFVAGPRKKISCRRWRRTNDLGLIWSGDDCDWDQFCANVEEALEMAVVEDVLNT